MSGHLLNAKCFTSCEESSSDHSWQKTYTKLLVTATHAHRMAHRQNVIATYNIFPQADCAKSSQQQFQTFIPYCERILVRDCHSWHALEAYTGGASWQDIAAADSKRGL